MSEVTPFRSIESTMDLDEVLFMPDTTRYEVIMVPEWQLAFRVGSLNAEDAIEWIESNEKDRRAASINLLRKSLVNSKGERIGEAKHVEFFKKKDYSIVNRMIDVVLRLNKLGRYGIDTEGKGEVVAAKND